MRSSVVPYTYVTVDWDYFVPEHLEWDLHHKESKFNLHAIWAMRGHCFHRMRTDGQETHFWARLAKRGGRPFGDTLKVSDSHVAVMADEPAIDMAQRVVIIDRHHDIFTEPVYKDGTVVSDCGNWLTAWLAADKHRTVVWVKPTDAHVYSGSPLERYRHRVTITTTIPPLGDLIAGLHVCRSGCWTPPWLDAKFIRFVQSRGLPIEVLQREWDDPMKPRWGLDTYRSMFAERRMWARMRAKAEFKAEVAGQFVL